MVRYIFRRLRLFIILLSVFVYRWNLSCCCFRSGSGFFACVRSPKMANIGRMPSVSRHGGLDAYTFAFGSGLAGYRRMRVDPRRQSRAGAPARRIVDSFMVVVAGGVGKLAVHDGSRNGDRQPK